MATISLPSSPRDRTGGRPIRVARLPQTRDQNPYQRMLYAHLADEGISFVGDADLSRAWLQQNRGRVDVLHIHWRIDRLAAPSSRDLDFDDAPPATSVIKALIQAATVNAHLTTARRLGYRVAWTVHEPARFDTNGDLVHRFVGRVLARRADVVFAHGASAARDVDDILRPRARVTSIGELPPPETSAGRRDRAQIRADLGVDANATMLLAFGGFRPDKDTEATIEAFKRLGDQTAVLVVAGRGSTGYTTVMERTIGGHPGIIFRPGFLADDDLDDLIAASDASVLGRSTRWTPSSLVHAIALGTPVVSADLAINRDHVGPGGWFFTPNDPTSFTEALRTVIATPRDEREELGRLGAAHARRSDWAQAAARSATALRLVGGRTSDPSDLCDAELNTTT